MDYGDAVDRRCSRRKYTAKEIDKALVGQLMSFIEKYNDEADLCVQLITNNGDAFNGFRKSYGMFSGVRNYLALVCKNGDTDRMEKEGYFGEKLVLEATAMGLSTCWVGMSYDKASCACKVKAGEILDCVIAVGYTEEKHSLQEKFMESMIHRKSKTVAQMMKCDPLMVPGWFTEGTPFLNLP